MDTSTDIVRHEARIDAGQVAGEGPFALATTAIVASDLLKSSNPVILVCWSGGSYGRSYWDLQPSGVTGYSAAEHWARQGYIVVAADQLGVGDSDRPSDGDAVRIADMAEAGAGLVASLNRLMVAGDLHPALPALEQARFIGVGHSLGGSLVVTQQALHRSYDAIVNIGFTQGDKGAVEAPEGADTSDLEALALAQVGAFFEGGSESYGLPTKVGSRAWLFGPGDDQRIVDEDIQTAVTWPRGPYAEALLPGQTAAYAAAVDAPTFLGFSEIDIPEFPRREPGYFGSANDLTLFVLPDAAHCSNFSPRRVDLWDRITAWERSLARHS
ncbi:alpha/beta hydrolase [Citricoccus nitrophenolicus]